ncbi:MAG: caspase family protein [Acidobacteria bacterium]|nr:caspase family protein [Acidobacteriota bacterium]
MNNLFFIALTFCLLATAACAQPAKTPSQTASQATATATPAPKMVPDPNKYALIISGVGGEEEYSKLFAKWSADLKSALTDKLAFAPENVSLLSESNEASKATAAEIRKTFTALRSNCKPENLVFIFFIGHGSYDGKDAKFNLVGPDLNATEYGTMIKALPAKQVVVINMTSASGEFIKPLSVPGHITITATRSGQETNATHFGEYFIKALTSKDADADQNQRLSVLEVFNYTTAQLERFYKEQNRLVTEHALLDDNGDGKGSEKPGEADGGMSKNTYFDSLLYQLAGGDAELQKVYADRIRLENEVEQLKARKAQMKPEEYENELEKLLLQLAEINEKIKAKQK